MPFSLPNDRIFFACQAVKLDGSILQGVQSIGISRTTAPEPLLDVGYAQKTFYRFGKEEYQITISRIVCKGQPLLYESPSVNYKSGHLLKEIGTGGVADPVKEFNIELFYTPDDKRAVSDASESISSTYEYCTLTSLSYSLSIDGQMTEDATFTTRTVTRNASPTIPSDFTPAQSGTVVKKKDFSLTQSVFPDLVSEYFDLNQPAGDPVWGLQSFDISLDFTYEELADNGTWRGATNESEQNRFKMLSLPVGVSFSIRGIARYDNTISYSNVEDGYTPADQTISMVTANNPLDSNFFQWHLGDKNYLTNIDIGGGDTGGGNVEITLNYQNDHSDYFAIRDNTAQSFTPTAKF